MLYAQRVVVGPDEPWNPVDACMLACLLCVALPADNSSPLLLDNASYGAGNEQQL